MLTFVTNYPDWGDAEHLMRSTSERRFGSSFSFIVPEGFDVAGGDYSKLQIIGDRDLAASASLWHLGRLATNAMLYLNRARPDVWASMTMFNTALEGTNRTEIYDCGCDESTGISTGLARRSGLAAGGWLKKAATGSRPSRSSGCRRKWSPWRSVAP